MIRTQKPWRWLTEDQVSASRGLATDECLANRVGSGTSPPTLRLYTYKSHCALIGRFQTVEQEIHVKACNELMIPINRRPTGGGAIIMGEDQLGVALTLPSRSEEGRTSLKHLLARFSTGLIQGLSSLGVHAALRGKNDLEVNGKKIAGLGIYRDPSGGLLFHASLLIDLDVPLMTSVLKIPLEKMSDKDVATLADRLSTVRKELGNSIHPTEVRQQVASGFKSAFDLDLASGMMSQDELAAIEELENHKYQTQGWIFQKSSVPDGNGSARLKTEAGLIDVHVALAGKTIKSIFIRGDFLAAENAIADLEASLRWHTSDQQTVTKTLHNVYDRRALDLNLLPQEAVGAVISAAIRDAESCAPDPEEKKPYGCFVNPEGTHGIDGPRD